MELPQSNTLIPVYSYTRTELLSLRTKTSLLSLSTVDRLKDLNIGYHLPRRHRSSRGVKRKKKKFPSFIVASFNAQSVKGNDMACKRCEISTFIKDNGVDLFFVTETWLSAQGDEASLNEVEVASGVPQGSVLGPMLFLLYINDINNAIKSQIKLFADDSVLYRNIRSQNDQVILQNDLDTISSWAEKWLMELNINKCSVLSITLKRNSIFHDYNILGATLKRVTNHDYLGVTISSDLNWLRHVTKISNKASRTLGLLKRTLSPCSQNVKSIAYKMLVRPQLEYASEVWSPYTMKCIKKIEQIQRNSCRFIFHEYCRDTDTSLLINRLNLDSLYARRLIQQATMFYKIHYSLVDICPPSYIQHANHISSRTDHPLKYCNKNPLQINAYKYSFFPRSMNIWNRLPCSAVSHVIPSVDNFHKFAIPAIRDMQPLYGAALI